MAGNVFNFQYGPIAKFLNKWGKRKTAEGRDMCFQTGGDTPGFILASIAVNITNSELSDNDFKGELILPVASEFIGAPATVIFNTLALMAVLPDAKPGPDGWVQATIDMHAGKSTGTITIGKKVFPCEESTALPPPKLEGFSQKYDVEFDLKRKLLAFQVPDQGFRAVIETQSDFQVGEYVGLRKMFETSFATVPVDPKEVYAVETPKENRVSKRKERQAAAAAMIEDNGAEGADIEPVTQDVPAVTDAKATPEGGVELEHGTVEVVVPPADACKACEGKKVNSHNQPCAACGGTGKTRPAEPTTEVTATKPAEKAPEVTPPAAETPERKRRKSDEVKAEKLEAAKALLTAEGWKIAPPQPGEGATTLEGCIYHLRVAVGSLELLTEGLEKMEADEKAGLLQSMQQPQMPPLTDEQADALKAVGALVPGLMPLVRWVLGQMEE